MAATAPDIRRLNPALGAEITGANLTEPLDNAAFDAIHRAFLEHNVLFFPGQQLGPSQLVDFARRFGPLNVHPMMRSTPDYPEVLEIVKNPEDQNNFGGSWHTDLSYLERPALASLLYAMEIPPYGGDTLFANMYLAYDALSDGMKETLGGLRAVHNTQKIYTSDAQEAAGTISHESSMQRSRPVDEHEEAIHPVIRTHPETGRKALYINHDFTARFDGMTEAESRPLIDYLLDHMARPEFAFRFRWQAQTLAMWDNRCTQHYALNDYHGFRRVMHRVAIEGDRPA